MSNKNSIARKKYHASLTPEQRTARARKMVKARWAKTDKATRSEIGKKTVKARWDKYKKI